MVCDIRTTEIRTHFAGYPTEKITVKLEEIPGRMEILRRVFTSPESFKPAKTTEAVTTELANEFAELANRLIDRYPPENLHLWQSPGSPVAHFLMKIMFCLFAEDIGLLPDKAFTRLINLSLFNPENFERDATQLFALMRTGGRFGFDEIPYFNGGLFDDVPALPLKHGDLTVLRKIADRNWAGVEPSIFGTLFERILDPAKRAQIGAHYTSKSDILLVVEPVVMALLRRKWNELVESMGDWLKRHAEWVKHSSHPLARFAENHETALEFYQNKNPIKQAANEKVLREKYTPRSRELPKHIKHKIEEFRAYLGEQRILDPACGSGNFLYVALQQLLDFEDEVIRFAARHDVHLDPVPRVNPTQMHGIEINPYAAELAQVVIWIGYLQWLHVHGIDNPRRPILDKLQTIENRDALLAFLPLPPGEGRGEGEPRKGAHSSPSPGNPGEGRGEGSSSKPKRLKHGQDARVTKMPVRAQWPEADFIIGNPPFLGSKVFRQNGLPDEYIAALHKAYDLPRTSDLCCYWFEQARGRIANPLFVRAGLLATQGIRW